MESDCRMSEIRKSKDEMDHAKGSKVLRDAI